MNPSCELCQARYEPRLVAENEPAFAIICKDPLKPEHVLALPKACKNAFHELSQKEAHDLLSLVEKMENIVRKNAQDEVLITKNTGKHSTVPHMHFHVIPSQGSTRKLIDTYENIPERAPQSPETLTAYAEKMKIWNNL